MIHKVYTVYDNKTEAYMAPFLSPAKGHAIRIFTDTVNDQKSMFYAHPGDFTLYEIGTFDDINCVYAQHTQEMIDEKTKQIVTLPTHLLVVHGTDVKEQK